MSSVQKALCRNQKEHKKCIKKAIQNAEKVCASQNKKLTSVRKRILEIIWDKHEPIKPYEILEKCSENEKFSKAPPTIYRAIQFLLDAGLIHKIEGLKAYVGCPEPNHSNPPQFLICENCKVVREFFSNEYAKSLEGVEKAGWKIKKDINEIYGYCERCQN